MATASGLSEERNPRASCCSSEWVSPDFGAGGGVTGSGEISSGVGFSGSGSGAGSGSG